MGFGHQKYNQGFLSNIAAGQPVSETDQKYGLRIVEADVAPGDVYWKIIGVHHNVTG
jgi:hypothetical protein